MRVFLMVVLVVSTIFIEQGETDHDIVQEVNDLSQLFSEHGWGESELHFRLIIHETLTNEQYEMFQKQYKNLSQHDALNHSYNINRLNDEKVKIIYDIQSNEWNRDAQEELNQFFDNDMFRRYFKNSRLYPCFQGQINDNINSNFISEKVVNFFNINVKNKLVEDNFQVISGSTHFFEQLIPLNNDKINIQFSVREIDETRKMVTIGTPILVIEY